MFNILSSYLNHLKNIQTSLLFCAIWLLNIFVLHLIIILTLVITTLCFNLSNVQTGYIQTIFTKHILFGCFISSFLPKLFLQGIITNFSMILILCNSKSIFSFYYFHLYISFLQNKYLISKNIPILVLLFLHSRFSK